MVLALASGISVEQWEREDSRAVSTALDLLERRARPDREARVYLQG